jgi:hypothetical protein
MLNNNLNEEESMQRKNHGRDATCPAENSVMRENNSRAETEVFVGNCPGIFPGTEEMSRDLVRISPAHAGRLLLAGMQPGLPARLVTRIDRFAMKIFHDTARRYCL